MKHQIFAAALLAAILAPGCCNCSKNTAKLNEQAAKEYLQPIRPASEGRNPCWNEFCKKFIYAPVFDIPAAEGATAYEFTVRPQKVANYPAGVDSTSVWSFTSADPCAPLTPIWASIPPAKVELTVIARDASGAALDTVFTRKFLRDFPFSGPYNSNVRPYKESAMLAALYIHNMPEVQAFKESTEPDMSYDHYTYLNKTLGGLIGIETKIAANVPALRADALAIARNAAQCLFDNSRPAGDRLEFFPPTYYGEFVASKKEWNKGKMMTMDACMAGQAFLDLFEATADSLYLDRALKIADTYAKIQNEDGSFPIKVWFETGEPVNEARAMLHPILKYVRRLEKLVGEARYASMRDRATAWMNTVAVETFDLTGQFEDVNVEDVKPYMNLTNCTAAPYASYLLTGSAPSAKDIADARDLIRLSEDQFVHWDALPNEYGVRPMAAPCVFEQHRYQVPVDNSSCNVANAYLDLYELTGDKLALAKAKALIDNLTICQNVGSGQMPTTFNLRSPAKDKKRTFWVNCSNASVTTLLRMAEIAGE